VEAATADARSWPLGCAEPASFAPAAEAVAREHLRAAQGFLAEHGLTAADLDLVGFHGQTVLATSRRAARRAEGRTVQLGDAALLARGLGLPVAYDFRTADVVAGGQGAPLAPVYHDAIRRYSGLEAPVAVLNLGGVGNITLTASDGTLTAFDTGPANGMIDLLVQARTDRRLDEGGALARADGSTRPSLAAYLAIPISAAAAPSPWTATIFPWRRWRSCRWRTAPPP